MDEIDLILRLKARKNDHLAHAAADALECNDIKHRDELDQLRTDRKRDCVDAIQEACVDAIQEARQV